MFTALANQAKKANRNSFESKPTIDFSNKDLSNAKQSSILTQPVNLLADFEYSRRLSGSLQSTPKHKQRKAVQIQSIVGSLNHTEQSAIRLNRNPYFLGAMRRSIIDNRANAQALSEKHRTGFLVLPVKPLVSRPQLLH